MAKKHLACKNTPQLKILFEEWREITKETSGQPYHTGYVLIRYHLLLLIIHWLQWSLTF